MNSRPLHSESPPLTNGGGKCRRWTVWPDWAIFESSWQHIAFQKLPKYFVTPWAILEDIIFWAVFEKVWTVFRSNIWSHWLWKLNCQCGEMTYYLFQQLGLLRRGLQDSLRRGWDGSQVLRGGDDRAAEHRVQGPVLQNHFLPYQDECNQCDQIGQFIGLWPTFQSLWQQRICPILLHI